jgi:hypothetical protein
MRSVSTVPFHGCPNNVSPLSVLDEWIVCKTRFLKVRLGDGDFGDYDVCDMSAVQVPTGMRLILAGRAPCVLVGPFVSVILLVRDKGRSEDAANTLSRRTLVLKYPSPSSATLWSISRRKGTPESMQVLHLRIQERTL